LTWVVHIHFPGRAFVLPISVGDDMEKTCSKCGFVGDASLFSPRSVTCKACRQKQKDAWARAHPDVVKYLSAKHYKENKEERKRQVIAWRKDNRTAYFTKQKAWRRRVRQGAQGPLLQAKMQVREAIKGAMKRKGYTKKAKTYKMLGCDYQHLLFHLGPKPGPDYDLDHICPCQQAKTEAELLRLQHHTNLRWMQHIENQMKYVQRTPEGELLCWQLLGREWIDD
jgi:hypothetical protein